MLNVNEYVSRIIEILGEVQFHMNIHLNIPLIITNCSVFGDFLGIHYHEESGNKILIQYPKVLYSIKNGPNLKYNRIENPQSVALKLIYGAEYTDLYVLIHELAHFKDSHNFNVNHYKGVSLSCYMFTPHHKLPWEEYAHNEAMKILKKVKHLWKIRTKQ